MALELTKQEVAEIVPSIQRFCREELELEAGEMRAKFILDYFLKEIAPFAYNCGVRDAEKQMRTAVEDLTNTCFEDGMGYWKKKR